MCSIILLFLGTSLGYGATVKKVNSKKGLVLLDVGADETLETETEICVYNENDKKIDCGTITKIKGKTATVKMKSKKKLKKIKPDMAARPPDSDGSDGAEGGSSKSASGKMPMGVLGRYIYTIAAPSTFKKNGYVVPTSKTPSTLWKDEGAVSDSALGFSLAFAIPVSKYSIIPGLRFRSLASVEVLSDYASDRRDPYVSTLTTASNLGLFADFQFLRMPLGSTASIAFFSMSSGLDIDASTVTFKAEKRDDTGATPTTPLASATSKLTVLSLRVSGGLDILFEKFIGLSSGLNVLLPLTAFGASFSSQMEDSEKRGVEDPQTDLKNAVGHKKSGFGAEFYLGLSMHF
jgi:hypothetical protein